MKNFKKLIGLVLLIFVVVSVYQLAASISIAGGGSKIVDLRVGEHEEFHRFVLELSAPAEYSFMRRPGLVSIRLRGVEAGVSGTKRPQTSLLALKSVTEKRSKKGLVTVVDITFKKGMKVEQYTERQPFRIVIDIYNKKSESRYKIDEEMFRVKSPTPAAEKAVKKIQEPDSLVVEARKAGKKVVTVTKNIEEKGLNKVEGVKITPRKRKNGGGVAAASVAPFSSDNAAPETSLALIKKSGKKPAESSGVIKSEKKHDPVKSTPPGSVSTKDETARQKTIKLVYAGTVSAKRKTAQHETSEPALTKSASAKRKTEKQKTKKNKRTGHEAAKSERTKKTKKLLVKAGAKNINPVDHHPGRVTKKGFYGVKKSEVERPAFLSGKKITIGKPNAHVHPARLKYTVLNIKKLVREEAKRELSASKPKSMSGTLESLIAYNESWRFIYRKKVNKLIQAELYKNDVVEWKVFRDVLTLAAFKQAPLAKEARALSVKLAENGKVGRAAVIEAMANIIGEGRGAEELAGLLRIYPDSGLTHLGWLILGGYYEKNGFYPEALAHYSRVVSESNEGEIKGAAQFSRARLLYLTGEFTKSKVAFRKLLATGYKGAGMWLANAYHMRGETDRARALYEKYVPVELGTVDPITLMGVGDLRIKYGDYLGAAKVFKQIESNDSIKDLAMAFLRVREADALLVNGEPVKAQVIYTGAYKAFKGEAKILAGLALADSMAMVGKGDSLMRAESFYHKLHRGPYIASQYAHLNMARVQLRLKLYNDAAIALDDFLEYYPTNAQHAEAVKIKADVMFEWIKTLFAKSKYLAVADAVSRYGAVVPFGKKGTTYYRIGKSYSKLSLLSEAVSALRASSDIGVDVVAERSMLELVNVYLKQKDVHSVERLANNFKARFPKSKYRPQLNTILAKAAYLKGDYKAYAKAMPATGKPAEDFNRASALARIKRHTEAIKLFLSVADGYKALGNVDGEKRALLGAADSSFKKGLYPEAVKRYGMALDLMGKDKSLEKRWALYMITQSYSKLKKRDMQKEALNRVVVANGVFGEGAEAIYKDDFR